MLDIQCQYPNKKNVYCSHSPHRKQTRGSSAAHLYYIRVRVSMSVVDAGQTRERANIARGRTFVGVISQPTTNESFSVSVKKE